MLRIAVALPYYNEEATIAQTIASFRAHLPNAQIWVCDNRSSDRTSEVAQASGAHVITETKPGKGTRCAAFFGS